MPSKTLLLCALWSLNAVALAAPVTETDGRMEVNWGSLRLRFYGEATAPTSSAGGEDIKATELRAWQDGLNYVSGAVRGLHESSNKTVQTNGEKLAEEAREAARQVSKSSSSYNTTYFGNGSVRVHLENALSKALQTSAIRFRQKESIQQGEIQHSGIVLRTDKALKPRATYQIVDEAGGVLFQVGDMSEDGFRKNLMGRWFKKPGTSELAAAVGKSPLTIEAKVQDDRFVVSRAEWESATNGLRPLLVNGQIAISLP